MRAYRLLLHVYPVSFRNEYAGEMAAIFERRRAACSNPLTRARLWISTIAEVLVNAALVHLDIARQDVTYVSRTVTRTPGFALTAIAVMALGVGAVTAAYSVTDFVLIRPLPFPNADRLVKIWETTPGYGRMEPSVPNYRDIKAAATSFESSGMYHMESLTLLDGGEPRRFDGSSVSADVFPTLGVAPLLGRTFAADDDREGAPPTLMLSYRLWQTQFGGDPQIVGRTVTARLDLRPGGAFTVIGVMPREFHFPSADALFWVPNGFGPDAYVDAERNNNWIEVVARLRPGVTFARARAEVQQLGDRLRQQYPKENKDTGATVWSFRDEVPERSRLLLRALLGAAICVLLIACANLANLLMARALDRRRELAVRAAMGAGRDRLARQLMTETLLLAALGGAAGVAIAVAAVPLLAQLVPTRLPIAETPVVDVRVLAFALIVTVATALVFGIAPIARASTGHDVDALREGPRAGGGARQRLRSTLVVGEIAASVVLLVCAGLLLRALLAIQHTDPGFRSDGVLTMRAELPMPEYRRVATRQAFYDRVLGEVRALPGVRGAGFISFLPISSFRGGIWPVNVKGDVEAQSDVRGVYNVAAIRYVTPGLFAALGTSVLRGRDVSAGDTQDRPNVAVVSESFARRHWPGQDPIGRHFHFAVADTADREVVGVVGDVRFRGLERTSEPQVYLPSTQVEDGSITFYAPRALAIRSTTPPAELAPAVRAILRRADPTMPITEVQTLQDLVERDTETRAAQLHVVGAFAAIAFLLAAVGLHGLLAFVVSQRTLEIGVRIALGAQPADVVAMVAGNGARLGAIGVAAGIAGAYAAARSMQAVLAGVNPADVDTFGAAVALVALMLMFGTLMPTWRALRIDPIEAIRNE